jgi:IS4 transposase
MHTLLDFDDNLPAYVNSTNGKTADNNGAYDVTLLKGSVIVADRFYNDFSLLNVWDSKGVFFVIRHKENLQYVTIQEKGLPENLHQHIMKDEIIELKNQASKTKFPNKLRRVSIWDQENEQIIELITNQFKWSPNTISELYKTRWQVEIFFRDINQLLHIKSFIGTSENAVMIQIWTALITILIHKAVKAQFKFD